MGLLSFFQRKNDAPSTVSAAEASDRLALARARARQRLIGAAVLVVMGVIGFPLIFETQPRPIPVDIPIEIPRKDNAPILVMPAPRSVPAPPAGASVTSASAAPAKDLPVPRDDAAATSAAQPERRAAGATPPVVPTHQADTRAETRPEAKGEAKGDVKPAPKVAAKPESKPEPKPEAKPEAKPRAEAKAEATGPAKSSSAATADAARAKSVLEGRPVAVASRAASGRTDSGKEASGRFVVQVGAFSDAVAVREARAKLDTLGLKSFTQPVNSDTGPRTRVRLGPFDSREQAEQALSKVRAAGMNAVVLAL